MTTQWEHRTAVVNGINIHYVTQGQGPPVIMLHGWPECGAGRCRWATTTTLSTDTIWDTTG